ncbi:hypothetical protein N646_3947 [Vibrio alginolyticus NBRC 15630 = ATCC 17749]|uniref:Uncharacterized protein n=1 Tax=Vibrio alginolyticus (strain ATCC 17749 / DSM 2171 / NBRC 15630 / NCIMB 1903 / NCTC 12160 / XII-53) TaxID=1219076 RepID=A0A2I3CPL4_VIBAX|nr:hypothetical protein N646_3947 [Vibrio alginolyticus NBRC 15630 = ATCC 17749]
MALLTTCLATSSALKVPETLPNNNIKKVRVEDKSACTALVG